MYQHLSTILKILEKDFYLRKKLVHIPNWVPISENNSQKVLNKKIIMVGRIEYQKRFDLVLRLLANTNFTIDIYGEGSLKEELQKKSEQIENINFYQKISNEDLIKNTQNIVFTCHCQIMRKFKNYFRSS